MELAPLSKVKERILETASDLFYRQGYSHTGINQIIEEAHVAKASLYQHFSTKEDLGVEYLSRTHAQFMAQLQTFVRSGASAKEKTVLVFDFLEQFLVQTNFRGCNFLNMLTEVSQTETKIIVEARRHKAELRQYFQSIFNKSIGTLTADEAYLLFEGCLVECKVQRDTWPVGVARAAIQRGM